MRVLVIKPGKKPEVQEINGTLESMQEIVGGLIQALYPHDEPVALVANDEGIMLGLPLNRGLRDEGGNCMTSCAEPSFSAAHLAVGVLHL